MLSPIALIPLIILTNADKSSEDYYHCIDLHPCKYDGQDLKKLSQDEYVKTLKCRIDRHMECIKTDIEKKK